MKDRPGQFLCVDDDGELCFESEEENKTNVFHLTIVKGKVFLSPVQPIRRCRNTLFVLIFARI